MKYGKYRCKIFSSLAEKYYLKADNVWNVLKMNTMSFIISRCV